jgi:hypothetical protein
MAVEREVNQCIETSDIAGRRQKHGNNPKYRSMIGSAYPLVKPGRHYGFM